MVQAPFDIQCDLGIGNSICNGNEVDRGSRVGKGCNVDDCSGDEN